VPLSREAQEYIRSLNSQRERDDAEGWAEMEKGEFQARVGPFVDRIEKKIDLVLEGQKFSLRKTAGIVGTVATVTALAVWEVLARPI